MPETSGDGDPYVVVVSEDVHLRDEASFGLQAGLRVEFARDSAEAFDLMRGALPAAVVVDIQTGNAGGLVLAKEMSQNPRLSSIPVLVLLDRDHDRWLARASGARDVRTKPLHPGQLGRELTSLIAG